MWTSPITTWAQTAFKIQRLKSHSTTIQYRQLRRLTTSWRPINGLFFHRLGFSRDAKYIEEKCHYCLSFFCFFTPYWHWWHSQVSRVFNYVSFLKSHFEFEFICGCRQRASSWQFQFSHQGSFANLKNTKWLTTCLHRVHEFGMTRLKNGTPYHDSDTFVVAQTVEF